MPGELKVRVQQQMREALKARQAERLAVLRMILNEIDSTQLTDPSADDLACVRTYQKKLTKARAEYEKVAVPAKLAEIDRELAIVAEFLPPAMSDLELETVIDRLIAEKGLTQRDFGRAMKDVLAQHGDRVDGGRVAAILKARLAARS